MSQSFKLAFDHRFAELPRDFYTKMPAEDFVTNPWLIHANPKGAELIGLSKEELEHDEFPIYFSGSKPLPTSKPLAMVYSGHQFGQWAGQLGDGRALLLGQVRNAKGELWDIQLKGSGKTPYSRFGDGRAALRSCIREYLCSEAMYGLGIPTTRSLAIVGTGEQVSRESMEPGAVFTRLSPSHIRFGHFEHFYYRRQLKEVKLLADHVITEYFPDIAMAKDKYVLWFAEVVNRTAKLIAQWQAVGFSHGVMNTDNMSILGLTIDYGPFGFMEKFDLGFICNHSDIAGRYAYNQQPAIGLWNLHALANALQFLVPFETSAEILKEYEQTIATVYQALMHSKLGIIGHREGDKALCTSLLELMAKQQSDYTRTFRYLADSFDNPNKWLGLFTAQEPAHYWLNTYHALMQREGAPVEMQQARLRAVNPKFVLRNWVAEVSIRAAQDHNDYSVIANLLDIMHNPYDEHKGFEHFSAPAPQPYQGLSVSCSS